MRNIENIFGAITVAPKQTPYTYIAVGGETSITIPFAFVSFLLSINSGVQTPGNAYAVSGNTVQLADIAEAGDEFYFLFDTVWSPKDGYTDYMSERKYTAPAAETQYTPGVPFSGVMVYINGSAKYPGDFFNTDGTTINWINPMVGGEKVYIVLKQPSVWLTNYQLASDAVATYVPKTGLSASDGTKLVGRCSDIATLRTVEPTIQGQRMDVVAYYSGWAAVSYPQGGGYFFYDAADTTTADDGVICFVTPGGKRWKRVTMKDSITPEMAGAKGDGVTDDTVPFKAAIACSRANGYVPVTCGAKSYVISDTLYLVGSAAGGSTEGSPLVGCNWKATRLLFKPASAIACVKINAVPGNIASCYMRDIHILPFDSTYDEIGYGLEVSGGCMIPFDRLFIERMKVNYRLNNELVNTWTEFNKFNDCESRYGAVGVQFVRMAGNDSFHGTVLNNFRIQVKQGGGIGIQGLGTSAANYVWLYNCTFNVKFFGGTTCYAFDLQNVNTTGNGGNFTAEGDLIFKSDDNSWFIHNGRFDTISNITYQITTEIPVKLGRFVFTNRASKSSVAFANSPLTAYTPGVAYTPTEISAATAAGYNFRGVGTNFNSPIFSCLGGGTDNGFFFGNIGASEGIENWHPGFKISAGGGILTTYNSSGSQFAINGTSYAAFDNASWRPAANGGISAGSATIRFNALYVTGWNLSTTGLIPTVTATYNIGSSTQTVNNIFTQNAVTVVSDKHFKMEDQELPEELIAAIGTVKLKMWKLKAAVAEKGIDGARWHAGVIAQEVKEALVNAGLDWTRYGLITLSKTDVVVARDEANPDHFIPVDLDNSPINVNADGYIDLIGDADVISTDADGVITLTRSVYMMRMDEFNIIRLAYLESKLG